MGRWQASAVEVLSHDCTYLFYLFLRSPLKYTPAGDNAAFSDAAYVDAGAVVLQGDQIYDDADIFTQIRPPSMEQVPKFAGKTLVSMIQPSINSDLYHELSAQKTNVFALDCVPRMLSRGQAFDTLSSQANIAGYRAVVEAAEAFPRFFAGQMTAGTTFSPFLSF